MRKKIQFAVFLLAVLCRAEASMPFRGGNSIPVTAEYLTNNLVFTENKGQVHGQDGLPHSEVKFSVEQDNFQLFILESGIAYQFKKVHYPAGYLDMLRTGRPDLDKLAELEKAVRTETYRMDMTLMGADRHCQVSVEGRSEDHNNYYNRNVFDVHSYQKVVFHNIYPGIDWVLYTNEKEVKYDFVLRPGADPSRIKLQFSHQAAIDLKQDGSLTLTSSLGSVTEKSPFSYQGSRSVGTRFRLEGNTVSFDIGAYDRGQELVIDPALVWATYYGGSGIETGWACGLDMAGNVYLAGQTNSNSNLIAIGGYQVTYGGGVDAFLAKFSSGGVRQWGTYYGGSGNDYGLSCAIDGSGEVYLAGRTASTMSISSGGHQNTYGGGGFDGFLAKFNSAGSLLWATYYGGSGSEESFCGTDPLGNVYLTGATTSAAGIASGGHQNTIGGGYDAFLVKFNSSGIRQWGTYVGGTNTDNAAGCACDASGNVYMCGSSTSPAGIAAGGHQITYAGMADALLVKFNAAGVRQWGTYYGGAADDVGRSCAIDPAGAVYLAGYCSSTVGIASGGHQNSHAGGFSDGFLAKFSATGTRQWGTYYGAVGYDEGQGCATDQAGNVFLTGSTTSTAGIAAGSIQNTFGGGQYDGFLAKFNSGGVRQWATYIGGNDDDLGLYCSTDAAGSVYMQGQTLSTSGLALGGHQNAYSGGGDAFLAKICNEPGIPGPVTGNATVCAGEEHLYTVTEAIFATAYVWSFSGSSSGSSVTNSILIVPTVGGTISAAAQNACGTGPLQSKAVVVEFCLGISREAEASGSFLVFPNPCNNEFAIQASSQGELNVYDPTGRLVLRLSVAPGTNQIDFKVQRNGLYLLEFTTNGISKRTRLIKEGD